MATRAPRRDDHPDDRDENTEPKSTTKESAVRTSAAQELDDELYEVRAVIRKDWKKMETAMRYLADR